jgi:hypothetical protein
MPQLDTSMYLSQVFWLLVIFTLFYFSVLNNILPNLSRGLKLRLKQNSFGEDLVFNEIHKSVAFKTSEILESALKVSIISLTNVNNLSFSWLESSLEKAEIKTFLELNKDYLKKASGLGVQSVLINSGIKDLKFKKKIKKN